MQSSPGSTYYIWHVIHPPKTVYHFGRMSHRAVRLSFFLFLPHCRLVEDDFVPQYHPLISLMLPITFCRCRIPSTPAPFFSQSAMVDPLLLSFRQYFSELRGSYAVIVRTNPYLLRFDMLNTCHPSRL